MKILILNPFIDSSHEISACLKGLGAAVLLPTSADEAMKMVRLHGTSLDLAIVHRELKAEVAAAGARGDAHADLNLSFLAQLRGDPHQVDLPVIVTSSVWGDAQFVTHQEGTFGANAYLHWPVAPEALVKVIEAVFDGALIWPAGKLASPVAPLLEEPSRSGGSGTAASHIANVVLEESKVNIPRPGTDNFEKSGISLVFNTSDVGMQTEAIRAPHATAAAGLELASPPGDAAIIPAAPENDNLEPHERLMLASGAKPGVPPERATQLIQLQQPETVLPVEGELAALSADSLEMPEALPTDHLQDSFGSALVPPAAPDGDPYANQEQANQEHAPEEQANEEELSANLPYLFGHRKPSPSQGLSAESIVRQVMMFADPVGDSVVPGGAANSPDTEVLKKYLLLREQDVAVLSNQLKLAREQVISFDKKLKEANGQILELKHVVTEQRRRIDDADQSAERIVTGLQKENEELQFQAKVKNDKVKVMEVQVKQATEEVEHLKERVRMDIRKIRVREKELSNKLELMRRDSEALIAARENKIVELKRKVDLLEFNLDLLQDQYSREKDNSAQLRERLGKAAQVVRVAGGLLNSGSENSLDAKNEGTGGSAADTGNNRENTGEIPRASEFRETA